MKLNRIDLAFDEVTLDNGDMFLVFDGKLIARKGRAGHFITHSLNGHVDSRALDWLGSVGFVPTYVVSDDAFDKVTVSLAEAVDGLKGVSNAKGN